MRSTRRMSWTRTVSWVIMEAPPGVACMDTRHPRGLLASKQVLMRLSIYDRPSTNHDRAHRDGQPRFRGGKASPYRKCLRLSVVRHAHCPVMVVGGEAAHGLILSTVPTHSAMRAEGRFQVA